MTISEQIREAALYADEPEFDMSASAFMQCVKYENSLCDNWHDRKGRTFLLLVAEALE